jgi:hypothetical protein
MRQHDDDLYSEPSGGIGLFAEPGPFDDSTAERDKETQLIGEIIWRHQGRARPISIGELMVKTGQNDRSIKATVETLIMTHNMLIGSRRQTSAGGGHWGYFIVLDREDFMAACGAYQKQIDTMTKRMNQLKGLASARGIIK